MLVEFWKFFRLLEEMVMKFLYNLSKFLSVNYKTDIHKRSSLRDLIHIALLQRSECLLEHSVKLDDILSDNRNL